MRDETIPAWVRITWPVIEGKTYTVYWADSLKPPNWDVVNGLAAFDITDNGDGTWTWTDRGLDPDMNGQPPGTVEKRFYKVGVAQPLPYAQGKRLGPAPVSGSIKPPFPSRTPARMRNPRCPARAQQQ